jgi:hypothetical protein
LRKLLNDHKGAKAAVNFVLQTDLLAQFRLVVRLEQAKRLRSSGPALDCGDNDENGVIENEHEQDNSYLSSEETGIPQAERTL